MRRLVEILSRLGARGPVLLAGSLAVGAAIPGAAASAQAALPAAAFLMIFGSLTAAGLAPRERPGGGFIVALLVPVAAAAPCLAAAPLVAAAGVDEDLALGAVLAVAGPPAASAAALATMLGLPPRFTFALSILPTLLCPLVTPTLVAVFAGQTIDPLALAARLAAVVGGAAFAAAALIARERTASNPAFSPLAASGLSVIGLTLLGVATASRARIEMAADPASFACLILGAVILAALPALAGASLFAVLGRDRAAALSMVLGLRNQSIVWAASGAVLPPEAERFLVAAAWPILALPLLARLAGLLARLIGARSRRTGGLRAQRSETH